MTEATTTQTNPAAIAKTLLDSGENLLIAERLMVRQVREYAAKNNISAEDAQSYINFLNGTSGLPAWLGQSVNGVQHANSREIFAINVLKTERDTQLEAFRTAAVTNGANADAGIAALRTALTQSDPKADETAITMFNAMGQKDGKPLSNYLADLVYPQQGAAYFNGIDGTEFFARKASEFGTTIANKASQLWSSASAATSQAASSLAGTAQGAGEQGESVFGKIGEFFSGLWEKGKDNFPGLAGGFGVGTLFYMIGNALSSSVLGNGWISRIIGLAIGAFGAMLGYRTFGGSSEENPDAPRSRVEAGRGLRHDGQAAAPDLSQLRDPRTRNQPPMHFRNPNDTDGVPGLSNEELVAQIQRDSAHIRQMNQGGGDQLCPTDVFAVQGSPRCAAPRQR